MMNNGRAQRRQPFRYSAQIAVAALFVFSVLAVGCAGYQIGNAELFPPHIRSIHVPIIESDSFRRFTGQQLTEAIVKQIELDTPFQIADAAFADSILICRLTGDRKRSRTLDRFGEPRVLQTSFEVTVDWTDRSGAPLLARRNLTVNDSSEFVPEGGQSLASANNELINKIAAQIVGQLENTW